MLSDRQSSILCIGPFGSGKTALLNRYIYNIDTPTHVSTIEPNFIKTTFQDGLDEHAVFFFDIGGRRTAYRLNTIYARAAVALIVVDLTNLNDLKEIDHYREEVESLSQVDINLILVGTHDDLRKDKNVALQVNAAKKILKQKAEQLNCPHFFVNNFDKKSVDPVFTEVHRLILEKRQKDLPALQSASESKRELQRTKSTTTATAPTVAKNMPIMAKRIRPRLQLPVLSESSKKRAISMAFAALLLTTLVLLAFSTFGVFPAMVAALGVASWLAPIIVFAASMTLGALIGGLYQWASNKKAVQREMRSQTSTHGNVFQFLKGEGQSLENNSRGYGVTPASDVRFNGFISARSSATTQINVAPSTSHAISPSGNRT